MGQALKRRSLQARRWRGSDFVLFGVTAAELCVLVVLTPSFGAVDWIYLMQHVTVLAIALTRSPPRVQDRSAASNLAVAICYSYPYAQMIYLRYEPGYSAWPEAGLVLVALAAILSFVSLVFLGRLFGVRPALRGLAQSGPYRFIRHPMYLAYVVADLGYNLEEGNSGTALLVFLGWASLVYRVRAEDRILTHDPQWTPYAKAVPYRFVPGLW